MKDKTYTERVLAMDLANLTAKEEAYLHKLRQIATIRMWQAHVKKQKAKETTNV